jgi:hypothetical protein
MPFNIAVFCFVQYHVVWVATEARPPVIDIAQEFGRWILQVNNHHIALYNLLNTQKSWNLHYNLQG